MGRDYKMTQPREEDCLCSSFFFCSTDSNIVVQKGCAHVCVCVYVCVLEKWVALSSYIKTDGEVHDNIIGAHTSHTRIIW